MKTYIRIFLTLIHFDINLSSSVLAAKCSLSSASSLITHSGETHAPHTSSIHTIRLQPQTLQNTLSLHCPIGNKDNYYTAHLWRGKNEQKPKRCLPFAARLFTSKMSTSKYIEKKHNVFFLISV